MERILIIDDDADIRLVTRKLLKRAGYKVTVACDGQEGLDLFKEDEFDLVITDMIMPRKNGMEVIQELKDRGSNVKIAVISGGGFLAPEFYLKSAKEFDVDLTLSKPFSSKDLLNRVKEIF